MEETITTFCKTLAYFCNHLQSTSDALKQSVDRRPIPLDTASSTFIQCLDRRVSSASTSLNLLESMSFGMVSFEELLGHCNEVYKKNEADIALLQDHLKNFGYDPDIDVEEEEEEEVVGLLKTPIGLDLRSQRLEDGLDPPSIMKRLEEDPLFEESLSLKNLGISDVCLATLASEGNGESDNKTGIVSREPMKHYEIKQYEMKKPYQPVLDISGVDEAVEENAPTSVGACKSIIDVSKDDYDNLPSYVKSLAGWEDLISAVEKMNLALSKKQGTKGSNSFHPDEITSLDLGPKGRSYLLLLVRMKRLGVETVDGLISYRLL